MEPAEAVSAVPAGCAPYSRNVAVPCRRAPCPSALTAGTGPCPATCSSRIPLKNAAAFGGVGKSGMEAGAEGGNQSGSSGRLRSFRNNSRLGGVIRCGFFRTAPAPSGKSERSRVAFLLARSAGRSQHCWRQTAPDGPSSSEGGSPARQRQEMYAVSFVFFTCLFVRFRSYFHETPNRGSWRIAFCYGMPLTRDGTASCRFPSASPNSPFGHLLWRK